MLYVDRPNIDLSSGLVHAVTLCLLDLASLMSGHCQVASMKCPWWCSWKALTRLPFGEGGGGWGFWSRVVLEQSPDWYLQLDQIGSRVRPDGYDSACTAGIQCVPVQRCAGLQLSNLRSVWCLMLLERREFRCIVWHRVCVGWCCLFWREYVALAAVQIDWCFRVVLSGIECGGRSTQPSIMQVSVWGHASHFLGAVANELYLLIIEGFAT